MKENEQLKNNQPTATTSDKEQLPMDEQRLQYECEQALLRLRFASPDEETEWKRFEQQTVFKNRSSFSKWIWGGIAAAAVITGIIFFSLYSKKQEAPKPMTVLMAQTTAHPITIEELEEEHTTEQPETTEQKHNTVVPHKIATSKSSSTPAVSIPITTDVVEKKGAVWSPQEANYTQVKSKGTNYNMVTIPRGKTYKITLNDGTEVWLNTDSRLSFPTRFVGDTRTVELQGEAYFKVARDEKRPFIVITDKIATHVLGTEFNVKAYQDSETHITLVKGSVKIEMPEQQKEIPLVPRENIACDANGNYEIKQVDTDFYIQWKDGYFYYDNVCLADVLRDLGHWYNLNIEIEEDSLLMNQRLHFIAERSDNIEDVIENLNMYDYLSVNHQEGTLYVCGK